MIGGHQGRASGAGESDIGCRGTRRRWYRTDRSGSIAGVSRRLLESCEIGDDREVIGGGTRGRMPDDGTRHRAARVARGHEDVVEPHVRVRSSAASARIVAVLQPEGVDVAGIEHRLHGPPRMRPPLSHTNGRRRSGRRPMSSGSPGATVLKSPASDVETVLMTSDAAQQRAQLQHAPLLGPRRVHRAQMHAEDAQRATAGHDFDEGVTRDARLVPLAEGHRPPAQEAERLPGKARHSAMPVASAIRSTLAGSVASCSSTRSGAQALMTRGNRVDAAGAAAPDVVGQQAEHQTSGVGPFSDSPSGLANSVRYGWPSRSPREADDDLARRLDVDRPLHHRHQRAGAAARGPARCRDRRRSAGASARRARRSPSV